MLTSGEVPLSTVLITLILAVALASAVSLLSRFKDPRERIQPDGKTVLITGGSQGLGLAVAKLLSARGANIAIAARSASKLELALAEIKEAAKSKTQRFEFFVADLTTAEANEKLMHDVTDWNYRQPPDIVWACVGMAMPTLFLEANANTLEGQMRINYWSSAHLLHSTLRLWLRPVVDASCDPSKLSKTEDCQLSTNSRHFIFTASTVAYWGVAGYAPYSPCKAALRSLCDSLRQELFLYEGAAKKYGIRDFRPTRVHMVTPGNIQSPGYDTENLHKHPVTKKLEEDDKALPAEEIALNAVKQLEEGNYLITTNLIGKLMKCSALGGSKRNGLGVVDFLYGCLTSLAALYIRPDMEQTVYQWGKTKGIGRDGGGGEKPKGQVG